MNAYVPICSFECVSVPGCVFCCIIYCIFSDSSAAERLCIAWHNLEFSVVITPCTRAEKMKKNVQRTVFLTIRLKGLYVVLSFMAHLDSTAVGEKSTSLILTSAVMDTGEYIHVCMLVCENTVSVRQKTLFLSA